MQTIKFKDMKNYQIHGSFDMWQETQLSLTNRATRLEVSQSHQTIPLVWFPISNFVSQTRQLSNIRLQKYPDLEIRVRGHSMSLKVHGTIR